MTTSNRDLDRVIDARTTARFIRSYAAGARSAVVLSTDQTNAIANLLERLADALLDHLTANQPPAS